MNLSVSTWNYLCSEKEKANLDRAVGEIVEDGFGIELWRGWHPDQEAFSRNRWFHLKDLLRGTPAISMHTAVGKWDDAALRREIELCHTLGATVLVIHPSTLGMKQPQERPEFMSIQEVADFAQSKGLTLALENGPMEVLETALEKINPHGRGTGFGICIDVGHANLEHQRFEDPVTTFMERFGPDIVHFHLADNHGDRDAHLVPGEGTIDWKRVCASLARLNYRGQCVLELNTSDARSSAQKAKGFLRSVGCG